MKVFYSMTELGNFIGCSHASINNWMNQVDNPLPFEQIGPQRYRFELRQVLTWLAERSPRHRRYVEKLRLKARGLGDGKAAKKRD